MKEQTLTLTRPAPTEEALVLPPVSSRSRPAVRGRARKMTSRLGSSDEVVVDGGSEDGGHGSSGYRPSRSAARESRPLLLIVIRNTGELAWLLFRE